MNRDLTGKIFSSYKCGKYEVIKLHKEKRKSGKHRLYDIKFLKTGFIKKNVLSTNVLNGMVNDPFSPSLKCSPKAFYGLPDEALYSKEIRINLREIWSGIHARCYDKDCNNYKIYGGSGVYVCDRWSSYANFLEDAQKLPNWDLKLKNWKKYSLNKDNKTDKDGKYCYSPETTNWANRIEQATETITVRQFLAISPNGEKFITKNMSEFSRQHDLCSSKICAVLNGRRKHHKHWIFEYLE